MQTGNTIHAILFIGMDYGLSIAIRAEVVTFLNQFFAQRLIVPDLAVKDDPDLAGFVRYGLMATT